MEVPLQVDTSEVKDDVVEVQDDEVEVQDDVVEVQDDGSEDSDEAYYNNRVFEQKECDITYEWEEEEEDTPQKLMDFSYNVNAKRMGDRTMNEFVRKLIEDEMKTGETEKTRETEHEPVAVMEEMEPEKEKEKEEVEEEETVEVVEDVVAPEPGVVPPLYVSFKLSTSSEDLSLLVEEPEPVLEQPSAPRNGDI